MPGDALILECIYNNDLDTPISFGSDLNQEMCFGFLTIIGQSSIAACLDFPNGVGMID